MKVSVCIRSYNNQDFIAQAVESALGQQVNFEYEIVIGDDASSDQTREILRRIQSIHGKSIHLVLHDSNLGSTQNLIRTYAHCKGDYVAFLDGDDIWPNPKKLQMQADYLDQNPDVTICGTGVKTKISQPVTTGGGTSKIDLKGFISGGRVRPQSTLMLRRACLEVIPEWLCNVKFDDLGLQILALHHGNLGYLSEITTFYRIHDKSLFNQLSKIDKTKWDIETWIELSKHLEPAYRAQVSRRIASAYYRLAELYKANGQLDEHRSAMANAVATGSFWDWLRHFGRSNAPDFYLTLAKIKKRLS